MDVRLPDGTIINNVPDGMSQADLTAKLSRNGYDVSKLQPQLSARDAFIASLPPDRQAGVAAYQKGPAAVDKLSMQQAQTEHPIVSAYNNISSGAVRGAGSIGATLMRMLPNSLGGDTAQENDTRRQAMDQGLKTMGADPNSLLYKGGKLGAEIAGTAGAGGALANGVARVAPTATKLISALQSGGFTLGGAPAATVADMAANTALRATGGAASGAVSAGMVNPADTGTGALIGGIAPGAVKVAGMAGSAIKDATGKIVSGTLGATTGAGGEAVRQAYQSGKTGATDFINNMRGNVSFNDVVDRAKGALQNMRMDRGNAYRSGMVDISADKSVIPFQPIQDAMDKIASMGSYKGQQINKNAAGTVQDIADTVSNWASLNPAEYHTPEGLDALKQAIGDIRDSTQFGTAARRSADTVYNAVKDQITAQAPVYSKVMKDYTDASNALRETERVLSLGDKSSKDTAIRKLQSLMRNNVSTNYGNRLNMANNLQDQGGVSIIPAIAGQAMNSFTPRGLIGAGEKGGAVMSALLNPASIPHILAAAPFASPRLMGEAAYKLGQASSVPSTLADLVAARVPALQNASNNPTLGSLLRTAPLLYGVNQVNQAAQR